MIRVTIPGYVERHVGHGVHVEDRLEGMADVSLEGDGKVEWISILLDRAGSSERSVALTGDEFREAGEKLEEAAFAEAMRLSPERSSGTFQIVKPASRHIDARARRLGRCS